MFLGYCSFALPQFTFLLSYPRAMLNVANCGNASGSGQWPTVIMLTARGASTLPDDDWTYNYMKSCHSTSDQSEFYNW